MARDGMEQAYDLHVGIIETRSHVLSRCSVGLAAFSFSFGAS